MINIFRTISCFLCSFFFSGGTLKTCNLIIIHGLSNMTFQVINNKGERQVHGPQRVLNAIYALKM